MADRRAAVTRGVGAGLSERHACWLVGLERKTFRYRLRRPQREDLRARLGEPSAQNVIVRLTGLSEARMGYARVVSL